MADIIQLLPDAIANQIAAGEVVQRPSSVVKELMENAIDAGATSIKLIVKDAGKTLIQVIDDGQGMSETDARMCFERHATSKIRHAKDLFAIRTMGFRGEALASIAAVAQVELRTRQKSEELGVRIVVEGSELKTQEACQCTTGSSFSVKNLFYNVPARRNFLKSDPVEMRHILDEFQRIACANPELFFSLHHNGAEMFHLPAGNLRQRIVGIFGKNCNTKLVPVAEETEALKISGFVGKPDFSKKTRGEQLFYVNNRFIKSGYLNHAITSAFEDLIPEDSFPFYVIFIEIDPSRIDINVHPTKQEIKFEDERLVYNYLKVAVRHGLGQYSITPTLDFDQEMSFNPTFTSPRTNIPNQDATVSNQGGGSLFSQDDAGYRAQNTLQSANLKNWRKLYEGLDALDQPEESGNAPQYYAPEGFTIETESITIESQWGEHSEIDDQQGNFSKRQKEPYQIHTTYIVSQIKSGFMLIDQQAAHERILYERYLGALNQRQASVQTELFPRTFTFPPADAAILREILSDINLLGFDIQEFGGGTFIAHGIPADLDGGLNVEQIIEMLLEQFKKNIDLKLDVRENIARAMARSTSIKRGQVLTALEMQEIIDHLFACEMPYKSPVGRNCFITFELDDLQKRFS